MSPNVREAHKLAVARLAGARYNALRCLDHAMAHDWDSARMDLVHVADDLAGYRAMVSVLPSPGILEDGMSDAWRATMASWDRSPAALLWDLIGHLETEIERTYSHLSTGH